MLTRHLLYLTSEQLCAYEWQRGRLSGGACFVNNAGGVDDFMDYLDSHHRGAPVYILTDLIEEDFQRVTLPHVRGNAARQLLQRRLLQQYRETPFRHHEVQGRELSGRRDDLMLLSALTNPSSIQPWVEALEELRIPLAGLYSVTLLSEDLVRRLRLQDQHLLLVTQQSAGWRQSYFQKGMLKFSRLTPAIDRDGNPINVGAETAKTQQFLTSVRLIARGEILHTMVVAPEQDQPALELQCEDGAETEFSFLSLQEVSARTGLKTTDELAEPAASLADAMLLGLLAKRNPASHYTLGAYQRYYRLWRARVNLYASAAILTVCCAVWTGINLWQYQYASDEATRLRAEAQQYEGRYRDVMAAIPPRVASTADLRAAVNVERMLALQGPSPLRMTAMVSEALEAAPEIRLLQLDWKVNLPNAAATPGQDDGKLAPVSSLMAGIPSTPPQALRVEAEIVASEDDYRSAVNSMNRFAQALARNRNLSVEVDKPPLDTRSSVKLSAKAGPQKVETARPSFTLNLMWKP